MYLLGTTFDTNKTWANRFYNNIETKPKGDTIVHAEALKPQICYFLTVV